MFLLQLNFCSTNREHCLFSSIRFHCLLLIRKACVKMTVYFSHLIFLFLNSFGFLSCLLRTSKCKCLSQRRRMCYCCMLFSYQMWKEFWQCITDALVWSLLSSSDLSYFLSRGISSLTSFCVQKELNFNCSCMSSIARLLFMLLKIVLFQYPELCQMQRLACSQ